MKKKKNVLSVVIVAVLIALTFVGGFFVGKSTRSDETDEIDFIIDKYKNEFFFYDEEIDVVGLLTRELLESDAYSRYYTKEEYEALKNADKGNRDGIGISFDATGKITTVVGNSPAYKAGIKEGGVLVGYKATGETKKTLNGSEEIGKAIDSFSSGETFTLYVDYDGEEQDYKVKKEEYLQTFVKYYDKNGEYGFLSDDGSSVSFRRVGENVVYPVDDDKVGIIDYDSFSGNGSGLTGSVAQFERALEEFAKDGRENLVIDLRNNTGGFVNVMCSIAGFLIKSENGKNADGMMVVDSKGNKSYYRTGNVVSNKYGIKKIAVLANDMSASASEALIGCLLDYNSSSVRVILEKNTDGSYKTYGKGIMQTTYPTPHGGAIKLTTAKIYWPKSGICIHLKGITAETDERVKNETGEKTCFNDALKTFA